MLLIQLGFALILLILVMSQATKSEGLTGTIGGKTESAFRGKPGAGEKIQQYTKYAAIGFLVISALYAITNNL